MLVNTYLTINLDTYAGNVDDFVCSALTGCTEGRDRYGGLELFKKNVEPLLTDDIYLDLYTVYSEHGAKSYMLEPSDADSLRICIKSNKEETVRKYINLLKKVYGPELLLKGADHLNRTIYVKVLGFDFVETYEKRKKL